MARTSPRPSMACSFCAPQSRDGGAMVAQELNQLVSTVPERSTKAMAATKFLGFVRQHSAHGPGASAPAATRHVRIKTVALARTGAGRRAEGDWP